MAKKIASATASPAPRLLVDIPTAAQMLSTTVWQVRELVWAKKLPVIKLGRRFLFTPASLEAFVKERAGS
jgi:excisionase family DNA binding protein